MALLHEVDESLSHTASCLSWRTSGSLQQIFGLQILVPAHPLTADPHYDIWLHAEGGVLPFGITGPSFIDLTNPTVAARANCPAFELRLPLTGTVVVTLGRPGRHVAAGLATRNYSLVASGGSEHSGSGMFRRGGGRRAAAMRYGWGRILSFGRPRTCVPAIQRFAELLWKGVDRPFAELLWKGVFDSIGRISPSTTTPLG